MTDLGNAKLVYANSGEFDYNPTIFELIADHSPLKRRKIIRGQSNTLNFHIILFVYNLFKNGKAHSGEELN